MGELIPFKKPAKITETTRTRVNTPVQNIRPNFISKLASELELVGIEVDNKLRIEGYLGSLVGRISNNSIAELRRGLRSYSLEELEKFAQNSSQGDWSRKPAFYRALVDEIDSRKLLLP